MPGTARKPEAPSLELPDLDKADDSQEVDVGVFELDMGEELDVEEFCALARALAGFSERATAR